MLYSAESLPIVPAVGFEQHLAMIGDRCRGLLNHFERAARIANNASARYAQDGRAAIGEEFLDDYDLLDAVGIEERIQYSSQVEENATCAELNYMRHLLVNDYERFRSMVKASPVDLVEELLGIAELL